MSAPKAGDPPNSQPQIKRVVGKRFFSNLTTVLASAALALVATSAPMSSGFAAVSDGVNYDDPNMAYTNDYVGDAATGCPPSLKGKALDQCLQRTGLTQGEVAEAALTEPAKEIVNRSKARAQ